MNDKNPTAPERGPRTDMLGTNDGGRQNRPAERDQRLQRMADGTAGRHRDHQTFAQQFGRPDRGEREPFRLHQNGSSGRRYGDRYNADPKSHNQRDGGESAPYRDHPYPNTRR